MRRLLTLQLVQSALADLARLDGSLAVLGEVLTGRDVVVETKAHLGAAGAHQSVRESPVGHEKAGSEVRGLFAGAGTEADCAEDGTANVSGELSRERDTYDMIEVMVKSFEELEL